MATPYQILWTNVRSYQNLTNLLSFLLDILKTEVIVDLGVVVGGADRKSCMEPRPQMQTLLGPRKSVLI